MIEEEFYETFVKTKEGFSENKNRKCDYVFTIFYDIPENVDEKTFREKLKHDTKHIALSFCKYLVFGFETCPNSGAKHLQGYLYFGSEKKSMISTMKILKSLDDSFKPWLQTRFGKINSAINYCKKGEQPKPEWFNLHEKGPNWGLNADVVEVGTKPLDRSDLTENTNLEQSKSNIFRAKIMRNKEIIKKTPNLGENTDIVEVGTKLINTLNLTENNNLEQSNWVNFKSRIILNENKIKNDLKGPCTNIAVLENQAYALLYDIEKGMSLKDLILNHPSLYFKYKNAFKQFVELHKS